MKRNIRVFGLLPHAVSQNRYAEQVSSTSMYLYTLCFCGCNYKGSDQKSSGWHSLKNGCHECDASWCLHIIQTTEKNRCFPHAQNVLIHKFQSNAQVQWCNARCLGQRASELEEGFDHRSPATAGCLRERWGTCDLGSGDAGQHQHFLDEFTSAWPCLVFNSNPRYQKHIWFQHITVGIKFPAQVSALTGLADQAKKKLAEFRDAKQSWAWVCRSMQVDCFEMPPLEAECPT